DLASPGGHLPVAPQGSRCRETEFEVLDERVGEECAQVVVLLRKRVERGFRTGADELGPPTLGEVGVVRGMTIPDGSRVVAFEELSRVLAHGLEHAEPRLPARPL